MKSSLFISVVLVLVVSLLVGCSGLKFAPRPNQERVALDAEDVVVLLSAAGFKDEEIVAKGRELRNTLARHGAADLRRGGSIAAMFSVRGGLVHVVSAEIGSFVYDPATNTVR